VDAMIVIGGKNSSNSKELLNNVSRFTKSFFIQEPEEVLEIKELKNYSKIGITAGASTLKEDVIKTKELLESIK
jgi:4-hydroxy-3-methylbut-2-enyl diphosphate reductase